MGGFFIGSSGSGSSGVTSEQFQELQGKVIKVEKSVGTLTTNVSTLTESNGTLTTKVTTITQDVEKLKLDVEELKQASTPGGAE